MCERLLRQSVCLHSQSPPQKLCVDDESLDSFVLVRTGAAIDEGASQPRRAGTTAGVSVGMVMVGGGTAVAEVGAATNLRNSSGGSLSFTCSGRMFLLLRWRTEPSGVFSS